jgi:predicted Ser/Thr protein kinase
LRDGAAFCGTCGERQPAVIETPAAVARYRDVLVRFLAGGLDAEKHHQLESLRIQLGVSLATHAKLAGELEPERPPPTSERLSIDVTTLRHLAVGARGLVRYRIDNDGPIALDSIVLATTLSGTALPPVTAATLFPNRAAVVALHVTPTIAGFHEFAGELRVVDLMGEKIGYAFANIHVRAGGDGPNVNVVNISQPEARVVDNSRSTFGSDQVGGIVGDGDWQPIPLVAIAATGDQARPRSTNPQRIEFAVKTEAATYQVTTTLAQGDISTIYGGHIRGSQPPAQVALKIADDTSDNDLLQHEIRVLAMLAAASDQPTGPIIHLAQPRDQFRTNDGRLGTVFDHVDGFDLTAVRDRCRKQGEPGLPPKHLVWVLRRSLAALGLAHKAGVLHGNLDPAHILVRPHDHNVWVIDWCWAVVNPARTGQGFKVINEIYSAPEVRDRGRPTPASDLYALGKCAIHVVGGDPATKTLPEMDPRLARLIKYLTVESQGGRPQDAWELYRQVELVRKQIWGAHEFVPLEL